MTDDRADRSSPDRRRFLATVAVATVAGASAILAGSVVREAYRFRRVDLVATLDGLEAPICVAWLCDLHHGPWIDAATVAEWVDAAQFAEPDLIVLGGDLVDHRSGRESIDELVGELGRLRAPRGVYAVWGNHDHARFGSLARFEVALRNVGIHVMVNRGHQVRNDLWLMGVDDASMGSPDLGAALQGRPADVACLLASHNPDLLPEVPGSVGLTLCGHTHGGQVVFPWIGPLVTSSRYGRRFLAGWVHGPARGYVSRGLGVGVLPLRWNCPAELTILRLRPVQERAGRGSVGAVDETR